MVDGLWTRDYQTSLSKILVYSWWLLVHFFLMECSQHQTDFIRCFFVFDKCYDTAMVDSFILRYGELTTGWFLLFSPRGSVTAKKVNTSDPSDSRWQSGYFWRIFIIKFFGVIWPMSWEFNGCWHFIGWSHPILGEHAMGASNIG